MHLLVISHEGIETLAAKQVSSDKVLLLEKAFQLYSPGTECPADMISAISLGEPFLTTVDSVYEQAIHNEAINNDVFVKDGEFQTLTPIKHPPKNVMCVGKNYAAHAIEMGSAKDIPDHPLIFTKAHTTICAHQDDVSLHSDVTEQVDYEGELAIVIGKKGTKIEREDVWDYIFGFTLLNDITARDLQARHKQFFVGKSLDGFCPIGPSIVTRLSEEELLKETITTTVNDEVRQQAPLTDMIFDVRELIHVLSKGMTLEPGDIIATGTPSGVGKGMKPPKFLKAGDEVVITIPAIGELRNQMV
ncbi:fumarylacetoacetate hydrolase family protein [Geomicrobium sp. JCM 19038]|uniref:fumarylacetoacetate hydrolase family protein n=1 Tax=Geomicrobium sp. JCM 19038 TaxID=1460635 RepID=UPI00045F4760|nr:fumarylacetoacetate hydrolase family protein [Geomicrobium sp. JCM 19038]GAK09373.1 fumarylacetoacetate hydrolase family protein [Geomicrobium sp. JCM 19038]